MAIRFKPPGAAFSSKVKYIYFGVGNPGSSAITRTRVGMVMFKDPTTSTVYYPYRLSIPIVDDVSHGSIDQIEYLYGTGNLAVRITPNAGYRVPVQIDAINCNGNYTEYSDYGVYTITGVAAGADQIVLSGTCEVYNLAVTIEHGTSNAGQWIAGRGNTTITITPDEGYFPPSDVTVTGTIGSKTYRIENGVGKLTLSRPSSNISVYGVCQAGVRASASAINGLVSINGGTAAATVTGVLVQSGSTVIVQFFPDAGRTYPADISVEGSFGDYSYLPTSGRAEVHNVTGSVVVAGSCPEIVKLNAPSISVIGDMLTIINNDENTTSFDLYVNGTYKTNIPRTT